MLAATLMAGSVLVLAGCNNTPAEPDDVVMTGDEMVVQPEILPIEDEALTGEAMTGEAMTGEEVVEPVVVQQPVEVVAE